MQGAIECQQYMKDVSTEMQARVGALKEELNPIYFNLLLNKLASALPTNFLLNIYKIKRSISVESSQQFLFDLQNEMHQLLLSLPKIVGNQPTESYKQFVSKNILKIIGRFKVLGYPNDLDLIREGY